MDDKQLQALALSRHVSFFLLGLAMAVGGSAAVFFCEDLPALGLLACLLSCAMVIVASQEGRANG